MRFDPKDPRFTAYVLGELDFAERASMEALLKESPEARALVEDIRATVAVVERSLANEPAPSLLPSQIGKIERESGVGRRSNLKALAVAAIAAGLVVASTLSIWRIQQGERPQLARSGDLGLQEPAGPSPSAPAGVDSSLPEKRERPEGLLTEGAETSRAVPQPPAAPVSQPAVAASEPEQVAGGPTPSQPAPVDNRGERQAVVDELQVPPPPPAPNAPILARIQPPRAKAASEMPLNGRSVLQLVELAPGVAGAVALDQSKLDRPAMPQDRDFNTEAYDRLHDNAFREVTQHPLSTFSIDVDTASYANVRRFLAGGSLPPADAVRIEELINYFSYSDPPPQDGRPFSVKLEAAPAPWKPEHQLVRIGLHGREIELSRRPPSNLVFLLDVSGSMQPPNKLPLLQRAFRLLVENLDERDRIAIAVYAGASGLVLPSTSGDQKRRILDALEDLRAGGSTNGASGILLAYQTAQRNFIPGGVNRVILATDGDFNVGTTSQGELTRLIEDKARTGVFLSVLGFGMGNYKDSTLEKLADRGNGNYAYIDNFREARKVLVEEMTGTLITIAKDVKIQVEFNPAAVRAYRLIGYENRLLQAEDFNDDTKDAGEIGAGHSVTALYEIVPVGVEIDLPSVDRLKYQTPASPAREGSEWLNVKLRYKEPDGERSQLLEFPLRAFEGSFRSASDDLRFAAAVAGFGMLLRDSPYKGAANWIDVFQWAESGLGDDTEGHRREFLQLIRLAESLKERD